MDSACNIINSYEGEDYSSVLKEGYDWETFYHLATMRQSLLNWYEFDSDWCVLELQGEYGALTGVLCDHCKMVVSLVASQEEADILRKRYCKRDNLKIYVGTSDSLEFSYEFDLILDICGLERIQSQKKDKKDYINYINMIAKNLKETGKLLTVVENRYGIKYFCGAREKYSGLPFFGINQCFEEKKGHLFNKKELEEIIGMSELKYYKFFYPLPDYVLPQVIFTDEYSSGALVSERLNPYHVDQDTLIAFDRRLYKDVINNNAIGFMSNSFLIECGRSDNLSSIISAVVSTDRDRKESFATCIHSTQKVSKCNLFPEGKDSLERLYYNIEALAARGIKVIDHKFGNNRIEMPYIREKRLSDLLLETADKDAERFTELWDRLYELIKQSSSGMCIGNDYILEKVYLDLVPGNIFIIEDELYVFDQEFVKENYYARYVLYRGIKYLYMAMGTIKPLVSIEELKQRFGLLEKWGEFEEVERDFIAENRQLQLYEQFNKWANCNRWNIARRGERVGRLSGEREN